MSHNLFGERVVMVREPAWHNLGLVMDKPVSAQEAVKLGKLDFEINKYPLVSAVNDKLVPTGKFGIFREPTHDDNGWRFFGVCSENYEIVQNTEIAEIISPLTDLWPVETVGALGKGETLFLSLDAGTTTIKGEEVHQYFLITDTRNGGTSMKIAFTPVRVVCQNTLVSGLANSTISAALTHENNLRAILEIRVQLLDKMAKAMRATNASFEAMANAAIDDDSARAIFADAYPTPPKARKAMLLDEIDDANKDDINELGALYDEASKAQESWLYYCNAAQAKRDAVSLLYEQISDEHPTIAGTAWAAYNAVVEFADYRDGAESRFDSALFGSRAAEKKRAFNAALKYIDG